MGKDSHQDADQSLTGSNVTLYELMKSAGISSVESLSKLSGISQKTIFNVQYRKHKPSNGTIHLLAGALKRNPDIVRSSLNA